MFLHTENQYLHRKTPIYVHFETSGCFPAEKHREIPFIFKIINKAIQFFLIFPMVVLLHKMPRGTTKCEIYNVGVSCGLYTSLNLDNIASNSYNLLVVFRPVTQVMGSITLYICMHKRIKDNAKFLVGI